MLDVRFLNWYLNWNPSAEMMRITCFCNLVGGREEGEEEESKGDGRGNDDAGI